MNLLPVLDHLDTEGNRLAANVIHGPHLIGSAGRGQWPNRRLHRRAFSIFATVAHAAVFDEVTTAFTFTVAVVELFVKRRFDVKVDIGATLEDHRDTKPPIEEAGTFDA